MYFDKKMKQDEIIHVFRFQDGPVVLFDSYSSSDSPENFNQLVGIFKAAVPLLMRI